MPISFLGNRQTWACRGTPAVQDHPTRPATQANAKEGLVKTVHLWLTKKKNHRTPIQTTPSAMMDQIRNEADTAPSHLIGMRDGQKAAHPPSAERKFIRINGATDRWKTPLQDLNQETINAERQPIYLVAIKEKSASAKEGLRATQNSTYGEAIELLDQKLKQLGRSGEGLSRESFIIGPYKGRAWMSKYYSLKDGVIICDSVKTVVQPHMGTVINGKHEDRSFDITKETLAVVLKRYEEKYGITCFIAPNISNRSEKSYLSNCGIAIGRKMLEELGKGKRTIGLHVPISASLHEVHSQPSHSVCLAIRKDAEYINIIMSDSYSIVTSKYMPEGPAVGEKVFGIYGQTKYSYNCFDSLKFLLMSIANTLEASSTSLPIRVIELESDYQKDQVGCTTVAAVLLKEILKDDAKIFDDFLAKVTRGETFSTPPELARISQEKNVVAPSANNVYREKKNAHGRVVGHRLVGDHSEAFKSEVKGIRTVKLSADDSISPGKDYKKTVIGQYAIYSKTHIDPGNAYLRSKTLAYAKFASDYAVEEVNKGNNPRRMLKQLVDKVTIAVNPVLSQGGL